MKTTALRRFGGLLATALVLAPALGMAQTRRPVAPGPECRTFATRTTAVVAGADSDARVTECSFSTTALQFTCRDSAETRTRTYASIADFVDEVAVVPPRDRLMREEIRRRKDGDVVTLPYEYDAQGRVTQVLSKVFTAWDDLGRPTAWEDGRTATIVYDTAVRTRTTTVDPGIRCTEGFDANGIAVLFLCGLEEAPFVMERTTINTTAQVCK